MKFPFFQQFIKSMTDLSWLRAQKNSAGSAWAYLILFSFFMVCLQFLPGLWSLPREIHRIWDDVQPNIPDVVATIEGGQLSIDGVEEPFLYQFPFDTSDAMVYIDTTTTTSPLSLETLIPEDVELGVVITATEATFIQRDEIGTTKTDSVSFSQAEPVTFTKADILEVGNKVVTWVGRLLVPFLLVFLFVAFLFGAIITVTIQSLIVTLIAKIAKKTWRYGEIFTVGLFAITLPLVIGLLLRLIPVQVPFLTNILLLIMLLFVLFYTTRVVSVEEGKKVEKTKDDTDIEEEK